MDLKVFLCGCGGNISDAVDLKKVSAELKKEADVFEHPYLCSPAGLSFLESRTEQGNRVLVGACSPTLHEDTFKEVFDRKNAIFQMVPLREEVAWTGGSTSKAVKVLKAALRALTLARRVEYASYPVVQEVAVIGGGIAGTVAALRLSQAGLRVTLLEREAFVGGKAVFVDRLYPKLECASCVVSPKLALLNKNPRVRILTLARVVELRGVPGDYELEVEVRPRYVNEKTCNGCGRCVEVCPSVPKALEFSTPHPVPNVPVLNPFACLRFKDRSCRKCLSVCSRRAIEFGDTFKREVIRVGGVVVATGFKPYPVERVEYLGYQRLKGVVTAFELEKWFSSSGPLEELSENGEPKRIAVVHCAGSRDRNHLPYCSGICCAIALKLALRLRERFGAEVYEFYQDLNLSFTSSEFLLSKAREAGVKLVRGRVSEVSGVPLRGEGPLVVFAEDTLSSKKVKLEVDLVVLVPGFVPETGTRELSGILGLRLDAFGFFEPKEEKTSATETDVEGIWVAGAASGPRDLTASTLSAEAAATNALQFLKRPYRLVPVELLKLDEGSCGKCYACVELCPSKAIMPSEESVKVVQERCSACGLCVSACPSRALELSRGGLRELREEVVEVIR